MAAPWHRQLIDDYAGEMEARATAPNTTEGTSLQARMNRGEVAVCEECDRTFDLTNETDAAEWFYGHDCEEDSSMDGSTIATPEGVVIAEQRHMTITTQFTGPECDGEDCDEIQHRAGCSLFRPDEEPTDQLIARMESATEDQNIDDETLELERRLAAEGKTFEWQYIGGVGHRIRIKEA